MDTILYTYLLSLGYTRCDSNFQEACRKVSQAAYSSLNIDSYKNRFNKMVIDRLGRYVYVDNLKAFAVINSVGYNYIVHNNVSINNIKLGKFVYGDFSVNTKNKDAKITLTIIF